jgi:hypothetical protein
MDAADKLHTRIRQLHALLGSKNEGERANAWAKLDELLARNKKTWNDLPELLAGEGAEDLHDDAPAGDANIAHPGPLDLIHHILQRHLHLTDHQYIALTLWIAHSFVYHRFSITPRLAFGSPTRGCGKTTALDVIGSLAFKPSRTDHISAAVLFRLIDRDRALVLIDEGDNQDLANNSILRAVLNSGHRKGGKILRFIDGELTEFATFAPLAIAVIGKVLPLPLLHRSIKIIMERSPAELIRFDPNTKPEQKEDCATVYRETFDWARQCKLNPDPEMPAQLRNRPADNWRPLISIADACG